MPTPSTSSVLLVADFIAKLHECHDQNIGATQSVPILAGMLDAHIAKECAVAEEARRVLTERLNGQYDCAAVVGRMEALFLDAKSRLP